MFENETLSVRKFISKPLFHPFWPSNTRRFGWRLCLKPAESGSHQHQQKWCFKGVQGESKLYLYTDVLRHGLLLPLLLGQHTNVSPSAKNKQTHLRQTRPPLTEEKFTGTNMNLNSHKDMRFTADFLLHLHLTVRNVKYQRGQFPGANYPLGLSPLCVCWVLNLKAINILLARDAERSPIVSPSQSKETVDILVLVCLSFKFNQNIWVSWMLFHAAAQFL